MLVTVQDCVSAGLPVVIPQLFESVQVLVCWLFVQVLQSVHCQFGVQVEVQICKVIGFPPMQPEGEDEVTVRVWVPNRSQADQSEYVNEVHTSSWLVQLIVSVAGWFTPPSQVPILVHVFV